MNPISFILNYKLFWWIALLGSLYQGIYSYFIQRQVIEIENKTRIDNQLPPIDKMTKFFRYYLHDFILNFICSLVGYIALYTEYRILKGIPNLSSIDAGVAIILVFLSLLAITGVSGILPYILTSGKIFFNRP